jgi:hypothetical protein
MMSQSVVGISGMVGRGSRRATCGLYFPVVGRLGGSLALPQEVCSNTRSQINGYHLVVEDGRHRNGQVWPGPMNVWRLVSRQQAYPPRPRPVRQA